MLASMDAYWTAIAMFAGFGAMVLFVRTWIRSTVERSVESRFAREMEGVRSDLRLKENKITALQNNVLGGHAGRQSLADKRRIEGVHNLWAATLRLDKFRYMTSLMQMLKLGALEEKAKTNPKALEFLKMVSGEENITDAVLSVGGEAERPFLPERAWEIFDAYRSLHFYCFMRLKLAATGISETDALMDEKKLLASIKRAMPHLSEHLDKHGVMGAAAVADPLRDLVLEALRASLTSDAEDSQDLSRVVATLEQLDGLVGSQIPRKAKNQRSSLATD